ncbi:MAG: hypothetical protein L6V89_08115 [Oscillospiraceae bacterium]|nr:MAG: hypothetical protein L6V89_08115 [Oscillospiraceae bacterium]
MWLYLWQNRNTVVIGRNQNPWRECNMEAIRRDGVTLVRRSSGGGAVFHDDGNLNFTFIAPKELYNLEKQLSVVLRALESFGLHAEFSGRNDILLDGRKFSGNAFSHSHGISMQHGTLLIKTDMTRLAKYLSPSQAEAERKGRDLGAFKGVQPVRCLRRYHTADAVQRFGGGFSEDIRAPYRKYKIGRDRQKRLPRADR